MKIFANILKSVFCLALIAGTVYLLLGGILMASGGGGIDGDPILEVGNAGKEPVTLFPEMLDKRDAVQEVIDIYDLTVEFDVKEAIIELYRIGCETWYNAPARGGKYLGSGTGGIDGQLEGKLMVYNERYYVKGDATADNAYPYYGFEEKHNYAYDVNKPEPLASIAAGMLGSARRFVYMPKGDWAWEGAANSSKFNTEGAEANFSGKTPVYKNAAKVAEEKKKEQIASHLGTGSAYYDYGSDIPDKTNYVINDSSVILSPDEANGVVLSLKSSEKEGKTVWTAEFSVTCQNPTDNVTKYAAHAIGKTVSSAVDIVYKKLKVKFELWETGYFRSWSTTERWEGVSVSAIKGTGFAEVASTEIYTYDIKEVTDKIREKTEIVLKADPAKPDVSSMISVKYKGQEVFK